jgi:hypothetical protein
VDRAKGLPVARTRLRLRDIVRLSTVATSRSFATPGRRRRWIVNSRQVHGNFVLMWARSPMAHGSFSEPRSAFAAMPGAFLATSIRSRCHALNLPRALHHHLVIDPENLGNPVGAEAFGDVLRNLALDIARQAGAADAFAGGVCAG